MSSLIFNEHFGIKFFTINCFCNSKKGFKSWALRIAELRSGFDNTFSPSLTVVHFTSKFFHTGQIKIPIISVYNRLLWSKNTTFKLWLADHSHWSEFMFMIQIAVPRNKILLIQISSSASAQRLLFNLHSPIPLSCMLFVGDF